MTNPQVRVYETIDCIRVDITQYCTVQFIGNDQATVMLPSDDKGDEIHLTTPTYGTSAVTLPDGILQYIVTWKDDQGITIPNKQYLAALNA